MTDAFASGLLLPALALALIAWLVPKLLSMVMPEGVRPLMVLALLASMIMTVVAGGLFVALYVWSGVPLAKIFEPGIFSTLVFFGKLAGISALVWGPIMVLSLAGLPHNWVKETW